MMKQLPKGITGFFISAGELPSKRVDEKLWKQACYHIARITGGVITQFVLQKERFDGNYHAATLLYDNYSLAVLCNAYYPVIAFTDQVSERLGKIHFIASDEISSQFVKESIFVPLDLDFLCTYPAPEFLTHLTSVEHEQIRSWRPVQLGDIIFNHWD